jgi:hypothetical protein
MLVMTDKLVLLRVRCKQDFVADWSTPEKWLALLFGQLRTAVATRPFGGYQLMTAIRNCLPTLSGNLIGGCGAGHTR